MILIIIISCLSYQVFLIIEIITIMKPETEILYYKYRYFLFVIPDQRNILFHKFNAEIDYEKFFDIWNYGEYLHWQIKPTWRKYNKNRCQIIKKFEYGKYKISIRPYFCRDIKNVILGFLFAQVK